MLTVPIEFGRLQTGSKVLRVAVVSSDSRTRQHFRRQLGQNGFLVEGYSDGPQALAAFARTRPDAALIDLTLVAESETELLSDLRARWAFPILALPYRGDESEEVAAIREGADDYLSEPVTIRRLSTRIRACLRQRAFVRAEMSSGAEGQGVIQAGALEMDGKRRSVTWRGKSVAISQTEFAVLEALAARPGIVKTREQLMSVAHEDHADVTDRTIDSHIKRLRRKLKAEDPAFCAIETLYGVGYRFIAAPGN